MKESDMAALPPRPKSEEEQEEKESGHLSENTLAEQKAGRENSNLANRRLEEEIEAGKKLVEINKQRFAARKSL